MSKKLLLLLFISLFVAGCSAKLGDSQPLGAFGDPFLSIQLAENPQNGYVLQTDGTDNSWVSNSGSSVGALGDLSDVATTTASTGDVLTLQADGTFDLAAQTGSGAEADWITTFAETALTPSTTKGIYINASSTIAGDFRADGNSTTTGHIAALGGNSDQWNTAFSWGDHSTQGYLTSVASDSDWTVHNSYPVACSPGEYVNSIGDTLTCTDATTEINSLISTHTSDTDAHQDLVTLAGTPDYITLAGQVITRGTIDIGDDTNLAGGTGITLTGDTLSTNDSQIIHDNLSGFVSNEHIDWTNATNNFFTTGYASTTAGLFTQGNLYVGDNATTTVLYSSTIRTSEITDFFGVNCSNQFMRGIAANGTFTCATVDISADTNLAVSGTLLQLTGDILSLDEGTLTNTYLCAYETANGLVCNTDPASLGGSDPNLIATSTDKIGTALTGSWVTPSSTSSLYVPVDLLTDGNATTTGNYVVGTDASTATSTAVIGNNDSTSGGCIEMEREGSAYRIYINAAGTGLTVEAGNCQ